MKRYIDSYRGLPRGIWVLALVVLVNRAGSMVLPFMSLYMTNRLGVDAETVGRVLTIYGGGAVAGVSLGGWLVDRVSKRGVMIASLVANALGFVAMSHIYSIDVLTLAMFLVGVVGEAFRPANGAAVVAAAPPERLQQAFALHQLAVNLGISVGSTIGGALAAVSYIALFYVDAASCFIAAVVLAVLVREVPVEARPRDDKGLSRAVLVRLGGFMVAFAVVAVLFTQFFTTATLYHNEINGFSEGRIGYLLAINTLAISVLQMPVVRRTQRHSKLRVIAVGCLMFAAGFAILPFSRVYAIAAVATLVWTIGELVALPATNAYIAEIAPPGQIGRYLGASSAAFTFGRMIAPLVGTVVFQRLGGNVLWHASSATALALAFYYAMADKRAAS